MTPSPWRFRCPECGSCWFDTRTTKTPRHRCNGCGATFERPRDVKTGDLAVTGANG